MINIVKKLFYYLFTSGLFIAISLLLLDTISNKLNLVNFFAYASASFFLFNLMQFNVVSNTNPIAIKGFLNHTLLGFSVATLFGVLMIILYNLEYSKGVIINIMLSAVIFAFILYFLAYNYGYLNFMN